MAPTLLHAFSTFRVGGPQIRFCTLANYFGPAYRHVLFAMDGQYDCRERLKDDVDVTIANVLANKKDTFGNRKRFRAYLKAHPPDLLISYNWGSLEWAMANWPRLRPHVHIEDGFGPEEAQTQLRRRVWARRWLLSNSLVVVPSRTLHRLALDVWKLDGRRVRYIPNGIDCERFAPGRLPALAWPGKTPLIGTIAALRREKNLYRLLDAFRLVTEQTPCRLLIAGEGEERTRLEAYAREIGVGEIAKFVGHATEPERIYASIDVFAISSDTEQMPTTVIEAMAAGLPIAGVNVGDISEMVSAQNRPFIVDRNDASLANAICRLLADPNLRTELSNANQSIAVSCFSRERMAAAYARLFDGK